MISSNLSTKSGSFLCDFASGDSIFGKSITNVGWIRSSSTKCSKSLSSIFTWVNVSAFGIPTSFAKFLAFSKSKKNSLSFPVFLF